MRTATNIRDHHSIRTLQDLRVASRARRSGKRPLPTTAILNLTMASNERRRLLLERMRLQRRGIQIARRLSELERELDELLEASVGAARAMRGEHLAEAEGGGTPPRRRRQGVRAAATKHAPLVIGY